MSKPTTASNGFTLIELLTVVAIITIIVGMVMAAAVSSRARAHKARARAEVRQLVQAWRAYHLLYEEFPASVNGNPDAEMTADNLKPLLGYTSTDNPKQKQFLELPDGEDFLDPWGHVYRMNFKSGGTTTKETETYKVAVAFPMRYRHTLK